MAARSVLNAALKGIVPTNDAARSKQTLTALRRPQPSTSEDVAMSLDVPATGADRKGKSGNRRHNNNKPYSAADRARSDKHNDSDGSLTPILTDGRGRPTASDKGKGRSNGAGQPSAVVVLRSFLQTRWDPATRLLNLEDMGSDPFWKDTPIKPPLHKKAPPTLMPAIWKMCATDFGDVMSISLANNKISSISAIAPADLIRFLPRLRNLSLGHNLIDRIVQLNMLSRDITDAPERPGLDFLNELILTGNPVAEVASADPATFRAYKEAVVRRFPTLSQLDGHVLAPLVHASVAENPVAGPSRSQGHRLVFPAGPQAGFADTDIVRSTTAQFLLGYLAAFDSDRASLGPCLVPESTFSLTVDTVRSDRAVAKGVKASSSTKNRGDWDAWQHKSRNLMRPSKAGRDRIYHGPESILAAYKALPLTSHPLSDGEKFVVDSWGLPDVAPGTEAICAVVHGELSETSKKILRSFSRLLILAPHPAPTPQRPCIVLSDHLTVRHYAGSEAWHSSPAVSVNMSNGTNVADIAPVAAPIRAPANMQGAMVLQLRAETKLNEEFARQCLVESQWDYNLALQNFARVRDQIPPTAFQ